MARRQQPAMSRRERQIMDIVYQMGQATAAEVRERLPDPPSYSGVRAMLRVLEDKGHLRHEHDGPRYVYLPVVPARTARESALEHLVRTFFGGSTSGAVAALLDLERDPPDPEELDALAEIIDKARREGR